MIVAFSVNLSYLRHTVCAKAPAGPHVASRQSMEGDRVRAVICAREAGLDLERQGQLFPIGCNNVQADGGYLSDESPLFADLGLRSGPHPHRLLACGVVSERQDRFFLGGEGMS